MVWIVSRWNGAGHRWLCDDPLQKKLRPRMAIEFGCPLRQRFRSNAAEQSAATERPVNDYRDALFLGQGQNPLVGFAFAYRVINLNEIDLLGAHHPFELGKRALIIMSDADVAKPAFRFP